MIIADSQKRFDTEIGQIYVLMSCGRRVDRGDLNAAGYCLVSLVPVPLTLRVLPVTDEGAHLTEPFAAGFARERFVLHVYVPVKYNGTVKIPIYIYIYI